MRAPSIMAVMAALSFTGINASRCQPHSSQSLSSLSEGSTTATSQAASTTTALTSEDASTSTAASSTSTAPAAPEPTCQEPGGPPSWPDLEQYESREYGTSNDVLCSQYCHEWADCKIFYTDGDSVVCRLYDATFEEIGWTSHWDFSVWSERACVIPEEPRGG